MAALEEELSHLPERYALHIKDGRWEAVDVGTERAFEFSGRTPEVARAVNGLAEAIIQEAMGG